MQKRGGSSLLLSDHLSSAIVCVSVSGKRHRRPEDFMSFCMHISKCKNGGFVEADGTPQHTSGSHHAYQRRLF